MIAQHRKAFLEWNLLLFLHPIIRNHHQMSTLAHRLQVLHKNQSTIQSTNLWLNQWISAACVHCMVVTSSAGERFQLSWSALSLAWRVVPSGTLPRCSLDNNAPATFQIRHIWKNQMMIKNLSLCSPPIEGHCNSPRHLILCQKHPYGRWVKLQKFACSNRTEQIQVLDEFPTSQWQKCTRHSPLKPAHRAQDVHGCSVPSCQLCHKNLCM